MASMMAFPGLVAFAQPAQSCGASAAAAAAQTAATVAITPASTVAPLSAGVAVSSAVAVVGIGIGVGSWQTNEPGDSASAPVTYQVVGLSAFRDHP